MADEAPSGEVLGPLQWVRKHDPYLGAQLVVLAAIGLDVSLPSKLTPGPVWLLPGVELLLLAGLIATRRDPELRRHPRRRQVSLLMIALVSAVNVFSLALEVHYLLHGGHESGHRLILAGSELWVTNVLLFGLWYWQLDRGGPMARRIGPDGRPDFLFPQMATPELHDDEWRPGLIDYLYVSFTNATAFSPTDAMPLTESAKVLMSLQALVALVTVGLVVARAVNILS
jgi:uncharacterized membrane protein